MASFQTSLRELRAAQKTSAGAPLYSIVINRPLGRIFAALAHSVGLTPNQVTMISAGFTFTGITLIAALRPSVIGGLIVALTLVIGYGLDAADGQLARLRGGGSPQGEWLDHVIDSFKVTLLHLAVLIMIYRFIGIDSPWLVVPLVFLSATAVHFFGMLLTDLLAQVHASGKKAERPASMVVSAAKLPTDYGLLCVSFLLLAWPGVFVISYTVMAVATVGYTALVLPRWYRRVGELS